MNQLNMTLPIENKACASQLSFSSKSIKKLNANSQGYVDSYKILAVVQQISSNMRSGAFKLFEMTRNELNLFDLSAKNQKTNKFFESRSVFALGLLTASSLIGSQCTEGVTQIIHDTASKALPTASTSLTTLLSGSDQKDKSDQQLIQMELETLKEQKRSNEDQAKSLEETSNRLSEKLESQKHLFG